MRDPCFLPFRDETRLSLSQVSSSPCRDFRENRQFNLTKLGEPSCRYVTFTLTYRLKFQSKYILVCRFSRNATYVSCRTFYPQSLTFGKFWSLNLTYRVREQVALLCQHSNRRFGSVIFCESFRDVQVCIVLRLAKNVSKRDAGG